ncbi:hypothetical protein, partial [Bordetella avium]|uniref:hypothetical protein n=1 Tax=Bordetella avium TaxID=521 RepID=UPI001C70CA92
IVRLVQTRNNATDLGLDIERPRFSGDLEGGLRSRKWRREWRRKRPRAEFGLHMATHLWVNVPQVCKAHRQIFIK